MKVAYVSTHDASDVRAWSGLTYHMAQSLLNQSIQLHFVGNLAEKYANLFRLKQLFYKFGAQKIYLRDREPYILKAYSQQAQQQLFKLEKLHKIDLIFCPGTYVSAYLESSKPIVFWSDATFASMINFYPEFTNLCAETIKNGFLMEQSALDRCKLAIYSSDWAAQSAIKNYQVDQNKVKVVSFGANIACDRTTQDLESIVNARSEKKCKLLFIGVNWRRKGGDVALEVVKRLNNSGVDAELTIVGCEPDAQNPLPNFVKSLGFISKSSAAGRQKLDELLAESHFLILPSVADCTPVVFSEANSFGLPCISRKVGGIPTIIKDDINGKLFDFNPQDLNSEINEYCAYLENIFTNYAEYKKLAMSSFCEYELRLNWQVAGKALKDLFMQIV